MEKNPDLTNLDLTIKIPDITNTIQKPECKIYPDITNK